MGNIIILPETTKDPISLMGRRAGVCWGADISDSEKNYKRGLDCINSNHGRVLEFVNIETVIEGYSARVIREWYTHIGGAPTRLQASTRYIDYSDFDYIIPDSVKSQEQSATYCAIMNEIKSMICVPFNIPVVSGHQLNRAGAAAVDAMIQQGGFNRTDEALTRSNTGSA